MNLKQLWSICRGQQTNFSWMNASWTYYPNGDPLERQMTIAPKTRIVRVTLDVELMALPREEWDDDILEADEEASDTWPLDELSSDEVASCVEQATYDPEMFAGSMLFLKVAETRVVSHQVLPQ